MSGTVQIMLDFVWVSAGLALVAFSLGLILGELKIVNIAQGDLMMVGAYSMYAMRDLPFPIALLATFVVGLLLGFVLERGVLRWVYDKGFMATLLATWGVGIVLEQGVATIFTVSQKGIDPPIKGLIEIGEVVYPEYRIVVAGGIVVLLTILLLLVYRTSLGLRLRASIDNVEMASVLGISPQRMFALVFSVAAALAVLAGALIAPTIAINPTLGLSFLAPAFFAVLISKPGSLAGPVVGAIAVEFDIHGVAGLSQHHSSREHLVRAVSPLHRSQTPGDILVLETSKGESAMTGRRSPMNSIVSPRLSRRAFGNMAMGLAGATVLGNVANLVGNRAFAADFKGPRPYKIGFVAPLTGPVAPEGLAMQRGFQLAVDTMNAAGGIAGNPVAVVSQDTQAVPAVAGTVVKKFIQEEERQHDRRHHHQRRRGGGQSALRRGGRAGAVPRDTASGTPSATRRP